MGEVEVEGCRIYVPMRNAHRVEPWRNVLSESLATEQSCRTFRAKRMRRQVTTLLVEGRFYVPGLRAQKYKRKWTTSSKETNPATTDCRSYIRQPPIFRTFASQYASTAEASTTWIRKMPESNATNRTKLPMNTMELSLSEVLADELCPSTSAPSWRLMLEDANSSSRCRNAFFDRGLSSVAAEGSSPVSELCGVKLSAKLAGGQRLTHLRGGARTS